MLAKEIDFPYLIKINVISALIGKQIPPIKFLSVASDSIDTTFARLQQVHAPHQHLQHRSLLSR